MPVCLYPYFAISLDMRCSHICSPSEVLCLSKVQSLNFGLGGGVGAVVVGSGVGLELVQYSRGVRSDRHWWCESPSLALPQACSVCVLQTGWPPWLPTTTDSFVRSLTGVNFKWRLRIHDTCGCACNDGHTSPPYARQSSRAQVMPFLFIDCLDLCPRGGHLSACCHCTPHVIAFVRAE